MLSRGAAPRLYITGTGGQHGQQASGLHGAGASALCCCSAQLLDPVIVLYTSERHGACVSLTAVWSPLDCRLEGPRLRAC